MSRIDEALKRASAGASGASGAAPAAGRPAQADVFSDAWTVADGARTPSAGANDEVREVTADPAPAAVRAEPRGQGREAGPSGEASAPSGLALFHAFHPTVIEKIVATPSVRPASVEQYRRLAGTLHHAQVERNIKIVMVTSAVASEGKTLTATNLALTFSESYHRSVLLIDGDLRAPALHEVFQVPNVAGLGDGLRASEDQRLSLIEISPRLTVLTAGRPDPDPMSGLTSDRMKHLLEEAAARFDWVIIDTPPVGLLPDANLLAAMVDTTLFVVRASSTPYQLVQKAVAAIGRDRIMGVVLNASDDALDMSYSYYKYYAGYGKKSGN